jgi:iron complex outermembrane recepter protein
MQENVLRESISSGLRVDILSLWPALCVVILASTMSLSTARADSPSAAQAPDQAPLGLEEIVVTAERREENLQKAPVPISVVSSDQLRNDDVSSQTDLTRIVPSVSIYAGGGGSTQAVLRGVGNFTGNTYAEQAVAFSVDGVYLARGESVSGNFFDLDRVEILKGPQGTLYGRNTNAGAINIITQKPIIGEFAGDAEVEVGNYSKYLIEGALNLPTSDGSALRIAGQRVFHTGYLSDGYDDQDEKDGRATWLWKVTEDLKLSITGSYGDVGGRGSAGVLPAEQHGEFIGPSAGSQQAYWTAAGFNPIEPNGHIEIIDKGASAQIDWSMSLGTLTFLPAYLSMHETNLNYAAGFPLNFDQVSDTTSAEIRLASPTNQPLTWLVGSYYFNENAAFTLQANQTSFDAYDDIPYINTRSYAGFGQATWAMTDGWRLILGARYTKEDKSTSGQITSGFATEYAPPAQFLPACVVYTPTNSACYTQLHNSLNESKITWKTGLEYDITSTSMLYGTVSTGFKAGGFYADPGGVYKPESLTAYTIGSKNRFMDNRLEFNAEAYYWRYKDKQVSFLAPVPETGNLDLITENAGNATLYGFEPEVSYLITEQDRFSTTLAYEHAVYKTFVYTTVAPGPTGPGVCPTSPSNGTDTSGTPLVTVNCSGFHLPNAPDWRAVIDYSHTFSLGDKGVIIGDISGQYRSADISAEDQTVAEHLGGYATANAQLTYAAAAGHWKVSAYINNLSNKESYGSAFNLGSVPTILHGPVGPLGPVTLVNPPRTYGLRLNASF